MIKKSDKLVAAIIILAAFMGFIIFSPSAQQSKKRVIVEAEG